MELYGLDDLFAGKSLQGRKTLWQHRSSSSNQDSATRHPEVEDQAGSRLTLGFRLPSWWETEPSGRSPLWHQVGTPTASPNLSRLDWLGIYATY